MIENGQNLLPIEIKAARTYNPNYASSITKFLAMGNAHKGLVLYAGEHVFGINSKVSTIPWYML